MKKINSPKILLFWGLACVIFSCSGLARGDDVEVRLARLEKQLKITQEELIKTQKELADRPVQVIQNDVYNQSSLSDKPVPGKDLAGQNQRLPASLLTRLNRLRTMLKMI